MIRKPSLTLNLLFKYYKEKNSMMFYLIKDEGIYTADSIYAYILNSYPTITI